MRLFMQNNEGEWVSMGEVRRVEVHVNPIWGGEAETVEAFFGKDFAVVRDDTIHKLL